MDASYQVFIGLNSFLFRYIFISFFTTIFDCFKLEA